MGGPSADLDVRGDDFGPEERVQDVERTDSAVWVSQYRTCEAQLQDPEVAPRCQQD